MTAPQIGNYGINDEDTEAAVPNSGEVVLNRPEKSFRHSTRPPEASQAER